MAAWRRQEIADILRTRIDRALITRALTTGDPLPGTREVAAELNVNRRVVAAAYQQLAGEGLVELRPRSGIFVTARNFIVAEEKQPSPSFVASILADGVLRGHSLREFSEHIRYMALGRKLKAAVIASTVDQREGIVRELLADYAIDARGHDNELLKLCGALPAVVRQATMFVTTEQLDTEVRTFAANLGKPVVTVSLRPGILSDEWLSLLKHELFVIGVDPVFLKMLRGYLAGAPGASNVRMLVAGRADVSVIPPSAPTYVTQAARAVLGKTRIPGRLIPPPRIFAPDTIRAIVDLIVSANTENA